MRRYPTESRAPQVGLVLSGGGARAGYQVGVLKAVACIRRELDAPPASPFRIIAGTSAGAINAAAIACKADRFDLAVSDLVDVWREFRAEQIYRADAFGVIRTGALWLTMLTAGWAIARWRRLNPRSLLDNRPLASMLHSMLQLERVRDVMRSGHLQALAVSASSYASGHHVTFYDTIGQFHPWTREQRVAIPGPITVPHLLASSAIPFVFPATPLTIGGRTEWFGDGSMRQMAPISPVIHLGAERVLVIGVERVKEPAGEAQSLEGYPSLAQIAGHTLSSMFLDALPGDIERLRRINRTLALLLPDVRSQAGLKPIDVLVIAPSQRLDVIAARHVQNLPRPLRALLRGLGVRASDGHGPSGAALASYLLFEAAYTRELIDLGESDTLARRDEVVRFFGWARRREARPDALPAGSKPAIAANDASKLVTSDAA